MDNKELINKAVEYAAAHAGNADITLEDIANHAGFSMDYFNRMFLSHTGFTVMAYVGYRRLKKAVILLRNTDKTVLDIALEVGYSSHEGFTKAFKKEYGMTPSDYRRYHQNNVVYWGELTDRSVTARFLRDNPDFSAVDPGDTIDRLLEKDRRRHAYRCTMIHYMGFGIVAPEGDLTKGFICIGDDRQGGYWLELVTDDMDTLALWLKRFKYVESFDSALSPNEIAQALKSRGVEKPLSFKPESLYSGDPLICTLPKDIAIRPLTYADKEAITIWAGGNHIPYIKHLLREQDYNDERVLEYGVFQEGKLIAVAGCGIDEIRGIRLNNCCNIRAGSVVLSDTLYRTIYAFVTNDLLERGLLPFDDKQCGDFAKTHGNFTAVDLGFEVVNYRYDVTK